jgi:hypothetical protein
MLCEEKRRLLDAYQYVTEKYSQAVTDFQRRVSTLSKVQYDDLYRMTEALRAEVTRAQAEFQSHVRVHRC